MTPQKAIRTDLFIWSSAAIVSSSVRAAICMTNCLSAIWRACARRPTVEREVEKRRIAPQAFAINSELEQFQTQVPRLSSSTASEDRAKAVIAEHRASRDAALAGIAQAIQEYPR